MSRSATVDGAGARIGPNAILQVLAALDAADGAEVAAALLQSARLDQYITSRPTTMVAEAEVVALFSALAARADARPIATDAGRRTGDYLLANRIPKPAQAILKRLPAGLAGRTLLKAIGGHAWTFAGSGAFEARAGHPVTVRIAGGPMGVEPRADPLLAEYYAATFARLFGVLVHSESEIRDLTHEHGACRFTIIWK